MKKRNITMIWFTCFWYLKDLRKNIFYRTDKKLKEEADEYMEIVKQNIYNNLKETIRNLNPQEEKQQEIFKKQIEINNIEIENLKGQNKKITQKILIEEIEDEETLQIAEETKTQNKNRIAQLEKENDILQNKWSLKKFLKRLPDILYRIFELASKYDWQAEIEDFESDLYDLIRFTLSNLIISNKKSLKIGISWVLETLFFNEKYDWQPH